MLKREHNPQTESDKLCAFREVEVQAVKDGFMDLTASADLFSGLPPRTRGRGEDRERHLHGPHRFDRPAGRPCLTESPTEPDDPDAKIKVTLPSVLEHGSARRIPFDSASSTPAAASDNGSDPDYSHSQRALTLYPHRPLV